MKNEELQKKHLWQDELIDEETLQNRLSDLSAVLADSLQYSLPTYILIDACEKLSEQISSNQTPELIDALKDSGQEDTHIKLLLAGIVEFMRKDNILHRLKRDLGTYHPFDFDRIDYDKPVFEAWKPLGVQVHVVPGNALNVPVLSMLEGLMAGNINILKNTPRNGLFAQLFMKRLIACDTTGRLKHFVYLFELSSKDTQTMQHIIHQADVVCVWGGEEAVKSVRAMTPSSIRFVDWGHKISFAYFANSVKEDTSLIEDLAKDICKRNQQACTSPQCVLVEVDDNAELDAFGEKLGAALEKVQHDFIELVPSVQEQAELTTITHLQHIEEAEGWGRVIVSPEFRYRILVDYRSGLQPSPLFRTIWVKPVKRKEIVSVLRPFNLYLQTCGLASGNLQEAYQLTDLLIKAGVERITEVGHQHEAYVGEPHDGVYALQRYTKRVGVRYPSHQVKGVPNFTYLQNEHHLRNLTDLPVTNKEQRQEAVNPSAKMYLKSGGSSGTTKIAGYSWEDWEAQISVMAESFMIGGLQPSDRCAILFSAGNLYGGLIATQKALEHIKASSFTIGSNTDIRTIAENILAVKPNVIMGMPSFLRKLFREEYDLLKQHTGFEKIYYGGELMTEEQKEWFKTNFGFQTITSPVYASNDALINGYACEYCDNGEFHVPTKVMDLEIVHKETNEPVSEDEIGRVLITLRSIKDPALTRYEIGDLAKWISTPCSCGHATPKFKLMGRTGDLVRCGAKFINFREIVKVLNEQCGYTDSVQMQIETSASAADLITIKVLEQCAGREEEIKQTLLNKITDLAYAVKQKNADLIISALPISAFDIAAASGKVRPIVDLRIQN